MRGSIVLVKAAASIYIYYVTIQYSVKTW